MNLQEEILKIKYEMLYEFDKRVYLLQVKQAKEEQEFPQDGDEYYVLTATGSVVPYIWTDDNVDSNAQALGNIFRTEEEAEFAVEKLKVEAELRKYSDSWNLEKTQYTFSLDWESRKLEVEYPDYNQFPNSYYFDSINGLRLATETVGEERIKKYIFGVE